MLFLQRFNDNQSDQCLDSRSLQSAPQRDFDSISLAEYLNRKHVLHLIQHKYIPFRLLLVFKPSLRKIHAVSSIQMAQNRQQCYDGGTIKGCNAESKEKNTYCTLHGILLKTKAAWEDFTFTANSPDLKSLVVEPHDLTVAHVIPLLFIRPVQTRGSEPGQAEPGWAGPSRAWIKSTEWPSTRVRLTT